MTSKQESWIVGIASNLLEVFRFQRVLSSYFSGIAILTFVARAAGGGVKAFSW